MSRLPAGLALALALALLLPAAAVSTKQDQTQATRAMYEQFPFPPASTPQAEAQSIPERRGFVGPSHVPEVEHFVFGGRIPRERPFRVMLAGGGTGDSTLQFVLSLRRLGATDLKVVHVDASRASLEEAQQMYLQHGVDYVLLLHGELETLDMLSTGGRFDYIDCTGVIHHTADPAVTLRALRRLLQPWGGIGLMVYGAVGRTSIYHMRELVGHLAGAEPLETQLDVLWDVSAELPPSNWHQHVLARKQPGDGSWMNVSALPRTPATERVLVDAFLHPLDAAFKVPELFALAASAGLRVAGLPQRAWYEPAAYLAADSPLLPRLAALPAERRWAAGELLSGSIALHELYLVPAESDRRPPRLLEDAGVVVVPRRAPAWMRAVAAKLRAQPRQTRVYIERHNAHLAMDLRHPLVCARIAELLDRPRAVAELRQLFGGVVDVDFDEALESLVEGLHGFGFVMLSRAGAGEVLW